MKILQANEIKKLSRPVDVKVDLPKIEAVIPEIVKICKTHIGKFKGAYAIAHCQIEPNDPMTFFVLSSGEAIINPVINSKTDKFTHKEGCLSYKFRSRKKVSRFNQIEVSYTSLHGKKFQYFGNEVHQGLIACIFQHEMDHFVNKYIY